jgi:protein-tyrosine-phosphatase
MISREKFTNIRSILIACAVNTARSRIAEGFFRTYFAKNSLDIKVNSCGVATNARDGMLISLDAILVMKEIGIELEEKSLSKKLEIHPELIKNADLVITMTEKQKKRIKDLNLENNSEIITLKEFCGKEGDIEDPSMKSTEGFRKARDEIKKCIIEGLQRYFPDLNYKI